MDQTAPPSSNSSRPPCEIDLEIHAMYEGTFSPSRLRYRVRYRDGSGGEIAIPWDELQQGLSEIATPGCDVAVLERFGRKLRETLLPANWGVQESEIKSALNKGQRVHLVIRSSAEEIPKLPWEILHLDRPRRFLAECPECCIRYELPGSQEPANKPTGRLLFAYSAAGGAISVIPAHAEVIAKSCERGGLVFDLDRDVLKEATRKRLSAALAGREQPVTVLHLLCHGRPDRGERHGLVFKLEPTGDDVISPIELRRLLEVTHSLRLVVICACYSGDSGALASFTPGFAQMLHLQNVPAVIASRWPLSMRGSVILTETLYTELLINRTDVASALAEVRKRLMRERWNDFASLQLYAHGGRSALRPFDEIYSTEARSGIVLLCHEAYNKVHMEVDAPELLQDRTIKKVTLDQTQQLKQREWTVQTLEAAVKELTDQAGAFQRAISAPDAELVYYGFPFVPLAILAGFLVKSTRPVHVFEPDNDAKYFRWSPGSSAPYPTLSVEPQRFDTGSRAAQVRISVSSPVHLGDCRDVLPESEVKLDLHFRLEDPQKLVVKNRRQVREYAQVIGSTLERYAALDTSIDSLHIFAAVPVSLAFLIGQALSSTGLPNCYIYNYGRSDSPHYKWSVCLQDASADKSSVKVFRQPWRD